MSVLGLDERTIEGERSPRRETASALDSVPGSDDSGRTLTSKVALDGCSAAKRTSIGPETEARDCVSPFDTIMRYVTLSKEGCTKAKPPRPIYPVKPLVNDTQWSYIFISSSVSSRMRHLEEG